MSSKDVVTKIIEKADEEFTIWNNKQHILPSRCEIYVAGYLAGVNNSKKEFKDLFIEEFNKGLIYDKAKK